MTELKPCPFCGNQPEMRETQSDERTGYANKVTISCCASMFEVGDTSKGVYADNSTTETRVVERWNTRAK